MKIFLAIFLGIVALFAASDAEPIVGLDLSKSEQSSCFAQSFALASSSTITTNRLFIFSITDFATIGSAQIKTGYWTMRLLYNILSTNLPFVRGFFYVFFTILFNGVDTGCNLLGPLTTSVEGINNINSQMDLVSAYTKVALNQDASTRISTSWSAIYTAILSIYDTTRNLTADTANRDTSNYATYFGSIASQFTIITSNWKDFDTIISVAGPTLISARNIVDRITTGNQYANTQTPTDIHESIEKLIASIYQQYNNYIGTFTNGQISSFLTFVAAIFPSSSHVVKVLDSTLRILFVNLQANFTVIFDSTSTTLQDTSYFSTTEMVKHFYAALTAAYTASLSAAGDAIGVLTSNLFGYSVCVDIAGFNMLIDIYTASANRGSCVYSRLYQIFNRITPIIAGISAFIGQFLTSLFTKCYPCAFLSNQFQGETEQTKTTDCMSNNCLNDLGNVRGDREGKAKKENDDYNTAQKTTNRDINRCVSGTHTTLTASFASRSQAAKACTS